MEKEIKKGEIIIYKNKSGPNLDVRLEKETAWLSLNQIAMLFITDKSGISRHINNIFKERELNKKSTVAKIATVQTEGKREIKREIEYYNLDLILSVGYRINSIRATQFRIWATRTLKKHLVDGYTINEKRLIETKQKLEELQGAIYFLQEKSKHELLPGKEQDIIDLLSSYSKTLTILAQYDKNQIKSVVGKKAIFILKYEEAKKIIERVKRGLITAKEASNLFGHENDKKFESIIKNLYQTFDQKELYKNIEEKAANLLYLTIKDHPFIDGNKRSASFLFIYFLNKNNYLYKENGEKKINDNALTALSLLVAISDPKEKDTMIKIITNLIK